MPLEGKKSDKGYLLSSLKELRRGKKKSRKKRRRRRRRRNGFKEKIFLIVVFLYLISGICWSINTKSPRSHNHVKKADLELEPIGQRSG